MNSSTLAVTPGATSARAASKIPPAGDAADAAGPSGGGVRREMRVGSRRERTALDEEPTALTVASRSAPAAAARTAKRNAVATSFAPATASCAVGMEEDVGEPDHAVAGVHASP